MIACRSDDSEHKAASGKTDDRSSCHKAPFIGSSRLQESSSNVMPRLNISLARQYWPCISSGARYLESPSIARLLGEFVRSNTSPKSASLH